MAGSLRMTTNPPVNEHDLEIILAGRPVWRSQLVAMARFQLDRDARIDRLTAEFEAQYPGLHSVRPMLERQSPPNPDFDAYCQGIIDCWGSLFPEEPE